MNAKNLEQVNCNVNAGELIHILKIGIIRQLHADNVLSDKQYAALLSKTKQEKFDN